MANSVVAALEQRGVPCWVAPRDVAPGGSYAESILTAIENASCFVLIYSEHSNVSSHVLREVERALKFGVNIVPVRFDDSTPSKSLDYLLATVHWLAIPAESRDRSIAKAAEQIAEWLKNFLANPAAPSPIRMARFQNALVTSLDQPRQRNGMLIAAAVVIALAVAAGFATGRLPFPTKPKEAVVADAKSPAIPAPTASARARLLAELNKTPKNNRSVGYAGVNPPPANGLTGAPAHNNIGISPQSDTHPPPPGSSISQYNMSGSGSAAPPDGRYGPPPPPPPPGRPMFGRGPGNGFGPGMPPNPDGPRP